MFSSIPGQRMPLEPLPAMKNKMSLDIGVGTKEREKNEKDFWVLVGEGLVNSEGETAPWGRFQSCTCDVKMPDGHTIELALRYLGV